MLDMRRLLNHTFSGSRWETVACIGWRKSCILGLRDGLHRCNHGLGGGGKSILQSGSYVLAIRRLYYCLKHGLRGRERKQSFVDLKAKLNSGTWFAEFV